MPVPTDPSIPLTGALTPEDLKTLGLETDPEPDGIGAYEDALATAIENDL
jgi:hypothetical protein